MLCYKLICLVLYYTSVVSWHTISSKQELEKAVAEIGNWEAMCEHLGVHKGACIFRPTFRAHFRILNINASHSNLRQGATKFKCNRLGSHIKTVKNWMLQLSNHCSTQTNWKLNAVFNTQIFKYNKLKIECCIQQSILQTVKKLNVAAFKPLFDTNTLKIECSMNNHILFALSQESIKEIQNWSPWKLNCYWKIECWKK